MYVYHVHLLLISVPIEFYVIGLVLQSVSEPYYLSPS